MLKQTPVIEWQIAESEEEWEHLCRRPLMETPSAAQSGWLSPRFLGRMLTLFLLIGAGIWLWRKDQVVLHAIETDLSATAQQELQAVAHDQPPLAVALTDSQVAAPWQNQFAREYGVLRAAVINSESELAFDLALHNVDFQYDKAVATVVLRAKEGNPAYRQTRFYRRTAAGWQRTAPIPELWGAPEQLATSFFVFHYRQQDAAVVATVVPQIEALYAAMRRHFGLITDPVTQKLTIDVSVAYLPGDAAYHMQTRDQIRVPSPALYLAPTALTDADILAQSLALPLVERVSGQAIAQYGIKSAWQPVLQGLRLWQLWDADLPLAAWRQDVVRWLYVDLPVGDLQTTPLLPERYAEFCAAHQIWMPNPVQIRIPLWCQELDRGIWYSPQEYLRNAPLRLVDLGLPAIPVSSLDVTQQTAIAYHPGRVVALATMMDYIATAYGRDLLPALVAGFGQYDQWETLLPAVLGVTQAEFEAGWQAYLADQYGVNTAINSVS